MSSFNNNPSNNSFNVQTLQRPPMPPMHNTNDGFAPQSRRNISTSVFNLHQHVPNPSRIGTMYPGYPGYNNNAWPTMNQVINILMMINMRYFSLKRYFFTGTIDGSFKLYTTTTTISTTT